MDIECYFCHQKGHVRSQCYKYKKLLEQEKKPVGLLASSPVRMDTCIPIGFQKHMTIGKVCSNADSDDGKKVHTLQDTGALQSVILRSSLPDDFVEVQAEYVLLRGFPNTVPRIPGRIFI